MASSSALPSSSCYDVFINHRGPDVKNIFASHLYRRLQISGLRAFFDREEMQKGEEISSQIKHAISGASVHIAIFSPGYAESYWCLDELVLMQNSKAAIVPVFYKVDPSMLRWTVKGKGPYAEALRKLDQKTTQDPETREEKPRYRPDIIQKWREALSSVADLSGFRMPGDFDDEGELVDKLVEIVLKKIPKARLHVAKYPTGLEQKLKEFEKIVLSQQEPERVEPKVVGIVGVGGVGKTTLAKQFFNLRRSDYNTSSFLFNVRDNARTMDSLVYLQKKLLADLRDPKQEGIRNPDEGIQILRERLSLCHALIVLDDVDDVSQLEALLPINDIINANILILVTSRNKHVFKSLRVLQSSIYKLKGLDIPQSKELFCSHAFNQRQPLLPTEFADLVDLFVTACSGLPLSLKVIGALLCGETDKCYWQEQLERLDHTLPSNIFNTLKISYDSLHEQDQPIFLDIACFFLGEDKDKGIRIWGLSALKNLESKCLLEVDSENRITMHDHIRDMGRNIAEEPAMHRRLWDSTTNIIDNLLEHPSTVMTAVRGIKMVHSQIDAFQHSEIDNTIWYYLQWMPEISLSKDRFNNTHFVGMRKLQLVATEGYQLEDILRNVQPPHLIWLRWYMFSHSSLPDWIQMKKLKVLEVEGRRLNRLWPHQSQGAPLDLRELNIRAPLSEIPKSIGQLKCLERIAIHDPDSTGALKNLPDEFCRLGFLKYLVFKGFSGMVSLPDSFGELTNLQHIDLEGASSLQTLPDSFAKLRRLKHLSLRGCENLIISNGTLGDITTLEYLDLGSCEYVNELPPQVAHQLSLQELYLCGTKLKDLPSVGCSLEVLELGGDLLEMLLPGLSDLKNLKTLSLFSSPQLKSLPDSTGVSTKLTKLTIKLCGIEYLPRSLLKMNILESLEVSDCPLREHPFKKEVEGERETEGETTLNKLNSSNDRCMFGLKRLELSGTKIRDVYFDEVICPNLQELTLTRCSELRQIGGLCGLPKLTELHIRDCAKVEELPGLETLTYLEELDVQTCEKLQSIPWLGKLTKLRRLYVRKCREIQALSGMEHFTYLETLYLADLEKLQSIPGLGQITSLRILGVQGCRETQALPGMEHLTSLERLHLVDCEKLQSIPGLGQLTSLRTLLVSNCHEIQALTGVEHLTSLEDLYLSTCENLQSIPGLGQLTRLRHVRVIKCREIKALTGVEHLISLRCLTLHTCEKLQSIPGLGQLTRLSDLHVGDCPEIQALPGVEHLTSLETLFLQGCEKLQSIPGLGQLTTLRTLHVHKCSEIQALTGLEHMTDLDELAVVRCEKLQSIPGLSQLTKLTILEVGECHGISELPGVEHLISLEKLNVSGLEKLKSIQGLGQLTQIRELNVSKCRQLQELSGVEHLISLEKLNVSGLEKLKSIPGLGQLTQIRELNVSKCCQLQELSGVLSLMSLKSLNSCECPKLRWREEILEQLREQLKEGFKYEKQRKICSCLEFLQSVVTLLD